MSKNKKVEAVIIEVDGVEYGIPVYNKLPARYTMLINKVQRESKQNDAIVGTLLMEVLMDFMLSQGDTYEALTVLGHDDFSEKVAGSYMDGMSAIAAEAAGIDPKD